MSQKENISTKLLSATTFWVLILLILAWIGCLFWLYTPSMEYSAFNTGSFTAVRPAAQPRLRTCENSGMWDGNKWQPEDDCSKILTDALSHLPPITHWIFIGDSTLRLLYLSIVKAREIQFEKSAGCKVSKRCKNCGCTIEQYMSLSYRQILETDAAKLCREPLISSVNSAFDCNDGHLRLEVIKQWFSNDQPTQSRNVTLFTLIKGYLELNYANHTTVCLLSTGIHDFKSKPLPTKEEYASYIMANIAMYTKYCASIIWVSVSAVRGDVEHVQNNTVIRMWNQEVRKSLAVYHSDVTFLSMYDMSNVQRLHADNVHLNSNYYDTVARFFQDSLFASSIL